MTDAENRNDEPQAEPTFAQRARTLVELAPVGYLSTISLRHAGFPFGSVMPFVTADDGTPLFLISALALHTKNLDADPRASLLVVQADAVSDPLAIARLTILGNAARVDDDAEELRERYVTKHPRARGWSRFGDFHFYRLDIVDLYYVGGFGVQQWIDRAEFASASADPLGGDARGIIEQMNHDHAEALVDLARAFAGIDAETAQMTSCDSLGFHLRLDDPEHIRTARIAFVRPVENPHDAREVLIEMIKEARGRLQGSF